MGIAISVLGKLGLPGVESLSTDQKFFEKWRKEPADTGTESKRKALLVEFMKEQVEEYKTSSRAMMLTGVTAPQAAILIKKTGEKLPQLKMLHIHLIPNFVFVPAFTVLSLIGVRISNVTRTTRAAP
ncbi:hypothetical protein C4D60_Mb04t26340 [Musa balbisiana]|uniref:Uncharacterized protein n=1 Tax=Musa balbisiana TaxID=52838 RepID=A0A4S8KFD0_MUSBA|nr:hypothetical protein C4D60_Mb04t26340 [Musa balbisiana]